MSVNNMKAGRTPNAGLFRPAIFPSYVHMDAVNLAVCQTYLFSAGPKAVPACSYLREPGGEANGSEWAQGSEG